MAMHPRWMGYGMPLLVACGSPDGASPEEEMDPVGTGGIGVPGAGGFSAGGMFGSGGQSTTSGGAGGTVNPETGGIGGGGFGGVATGGESAGGTGTGGVGDRGLGTGGDGSGGMAAGGMGTGGTMACDTSPPPGSVAAWIDESWAAEGANNILNRSAWIFDAAVKGGGELNICVRWGATRTATTAIRDQVAPTMQAWFNRWFSLLYPYDCFPYENVRVNLTGWAVRPGQESLIGWSDGSVPIYTDQETGSDPPGEPKCPDSCGFFFNWDHDFSGCPGGEANHFDYSLWLDDALPGGGGAAAVGGDWGLRMPLGGFQNALGNPSSNVILHEIGHGFGLSDYYTWTGSRPEGGSLMIVGSAFGGGPTLGDQWILRRYWSEAKADRYPGL
jgi:hypothetical protein